MERKTIEVSWESSGVWNLEAILEEKMRELKRETSRVPVLDSLTVNSKKINFEIKYKEIPEAEGPIIGVLTLTSSDGEIKSCDMTSPTGVFYGVIGWAEDKTWYKEGPFTFKCVFKLRDIFFRRKNISEFKKIEPPSTPEISTQWIEEFIREEIAPEGMTVEEGKKYYDTYEYDIRVREGRLDDLPLKDIPIKTTGFCDINFSKQAGHKIFLLVKNGNTIECWEPDDDEFTLTQYIQEFQRIHPEFEILYAVFVCVDDSYSEYVQVTDEDYVIIPISKQEAQDE